MKEYIFTCHPLSRKWETSNHSKDANRSVQASAPIFLAAAMDDGADNVALFAWCPVHETYEEVAEIEEDAVLTQAHCRLSGMAVSPFPWSPFAWGNSSQPVLVPLRFRVFHRTDSGTVSLGADCVWVSLVAGYDRGRDRRVLRLHAQQDVCQSISIHLQTKKVFRIGNMEDIPFPVLQAFLSLLQDEAERIYGVRPELPALARQFQPDAAWQWFRPTGMEQVEAFLHSPFDMNRHYLAPYLFHYGGANVSEAQDAWTGFQKLCRSLGIEPEDELHRQYTANPFTLIVTVLLERLGFQDRRLMRPFFERPFFCGESLRQGFTVGRWCFGLYRPTGYDPVIFEDDEAMEGYLAGRRDTYGAWDAFVFYCRWKLSRCGEAAFAEELREVQEEWDPIFPATLTLIFQEFPLLPQSLKEDILRNKLSLSLHNRIVAAINGAKIRAPEFSYTEKELEYEVEIDGFSFHLLHSSEEFFRERARAGYGRSATKLPPRCEGMLLVSMREKGQTVACFQLFQGILEEYYGSPPTMVDIKEAKIRIALLHWLSFTGLKQEFRSFFEDDIPYLKQTDFHVTRKSMRTLLLSELLALPESKIGKGYYARLYRAILREGILPAAVVGDGSKDTELDRLTAILPCGKRIFEAAFCGNPEAQHILGLLYQDKEDRKLIPQDTERSLYWLNLSTAGLLKKKAHQEDGARG